MKNKTIILANDSYTVLGTLGEGGQASVYRVRRESDGAELAMKSVLTFKMTKSDHKAFLNEATIENNSLKLTNEIKFLKSLPDTEQVFIVPCLDSGVIKDERYGDLPAWVMPLYPQTLEYKMPPYPAGKLLPEFSECLKWFQQVAIALQATHSFRADKTAFVHRDIKAANMMLTENEDIRLIDFGIVHEATLEKDTSTHSYSPESGAPEQILAIANHEGKNVYAMGPYSDLYALGTVIYRLFTGKNTKAQFELKHKDTLAKHFKMLDEDNTGLVGTIGGLKDDEYKALYEEIQLRLEEELELDSGTVISSNTLSGSSNHGLPNDQQIAEPCADFIRDLLHPEHNKRPAASDMMEWCAVIKSALAPELSQLSLSAKTNKLTSNTPVTLLLTLQGKGLPADASWVKLSVNGKPIHNIVYTLQEAQASYGFVTEQPQHWQLTLPAHNKTDSLRVLVEASVNGEMQSDNVTLEKKLPVKDPQQETSSAQKPVSKMWLKVSGIVAVLVALGVAGLFWKAMDSKPPVADISQLQSALNGQDSPTRLAAWKQLNKLSKTENSHAAQTAIDGFIQQSIVLLKSNDRDKQQQAIPRLQLVAKSGNKSVMKPLAKAYYLGNGTTLDWGKSWKWYQKSNAEAERKQLEQESNGLLHNKTAPAQQRKLAYQVVEIVAKNEVTGDPSQKWMEYRYRTGDGVPINLEKAEKWMKIYQGVTLEAPVVDNN